MLPLPSLVKVETSHLKQTRPHLKLRFTCLPQFFQDLLLPFLTSPAPKISPHIPYFPSPHFLHLSYISNSHFSSIPLLPSPLPITSPTFRSLIFPYLSFSHSPLTSPYSYYHYFTYFIFPKVPLRFLLRFHYFSRKIMILSWNRKFNEAIIFDSELNQIISEKKYDSDLELRKQNVRKE